MADKVYIFIADGFEEIEGLTVVDILRRAGVDIQMVSIMGTRQITGSHGIRLETDLVFEDADLKNAVAYVIPGGMPGTGYLGAHKGLCALLCEAKKKGTLIGAICAAPSVLGDLGLLQGEKAACYPGFEDRLTGAQVLHEEVVESGQVITSRGMGTAIPFALALTARLKGEQAAAQLGAAIIYRQ